MTGLSTIITECYNKKTTLLKEKKPPTGGLFYYSYNFGETYLTIKDEIHQCNHIKDINITIGI